MSEKFPSAEGKSDAGAILERFHTGDITAEQFLTLFRDHDQATPERIGARDVVEILERPEVSTRFKNTELGAMYFGLLSLSLFHMGQQEGVRGTPDALEYFERALNAAKEEDKSVLDESHWTDYVDATAAYFAKDIERMRNAADRMPQDPDDVNTIIVQSLLKGLEERGTIDYETDYSRR